MNNKRWNKLFNSIALALVLTLALPWSAFAAELNSSEIDGFVNDVTVVQGNTTSFPIALQASGSMSCSITSGNPSTAAVKTSYSIASNGSVSSANFAGGFPFWGAGASNCTVTWATAPAPYIVGATVSAAATTPIGNYPITLSSAAGTTLFTNPSVQGGKLSDDVATTITVHVVAPPTQNTVLAVNPASGTYGGTTTFSARLTANGTGVTGKPVNFTRNGAGVGTATTDSSGLATLNGVSLVGINAGTYSNGVGATFAGAPGYNGSNGANTLTVNTATATITLGNLSQTYDGSPKAATATTNPPGLSGVTITYDGSSTAPTNASNYAVVASLNNPNYTAQNATGTLIISRAQATITLGNLSHTYDGQPHAATATTNPANLSGITITYDGSAQVPTNAGNYAVKASLSNSNYQADSATGTLVINKAGATVTLHNLSHTYDGTAKAATATTDPSGLNVSISYSQNGQPVVTPTNAGSYAVVATTNESNYDGGATDTLVIGKANQTINFAPLTDKTFNDANFMVSATASSGLLVSFMADGDCTNSGSTVHITGAGSCTITASQSGNGNYNAAQDVPRSFTIDKAHATVTLSNLQHTYDGSAHAATVETNPAGLNVVVTYVGSAQAPSNAGSYAVVATVDDPNYEGGAEDTLIIAKAGATVILDNLSYVYNGQAHAATATTNPEGVTVNITYDDSASAPINAGSYAVVATVEDANYEGSASSTLVIAKAEQAIDFAALGNKTFGNADFAVSATASSGLDVSFAAIGNCSVTNSTVHITGAGSCTITASQAGNNNYNAADSVECSFSIAKAQATVALSDLSYVYNGSAHAATVQTNPSGLTVNITYDGSASAPTSAGSYAVVATIDEANYEGSANGTLVIAKAPATIGLSNLQFIYNGLPHAATATTDPAGLNGVTVTYNGSTQASTNASSYAVVASLNNPNYEAPVANGTLTIDKALATVELSNLSHTYDGSAKQATVQTNPAGLNVVVTYAGQADAPVNAGSYAVVATLDDPNYQGSDNATLVIDQADQTITFAQLGSKTYGDADFTVSATGGGSGNPVTFAASNQCSVSGNTVHITGAGSCTIIASQAGSANYKAAQNVEQSFIIAKAQATITLSNLDYTYDGQAHSATVQTNPSGLNVVVKYNGSDTAPSAVGNYAVEATINDANYQGSATGTLTIASWTTKGFYQPVDMTVPYATPIYNTIKGGSTVPLKFQVFQAGTERKDTAAVKSLTYATTNCASNATVDEIETLASGGTALRYDTTASQFVYNWKTPTALGCYRVTVTMADSSTIMAYFKTR